MASSISTAPSPLPSAPTPPSSAAAAAAASTLPSVNGPHKSGTESISLRAMAQQAVDQQGSAPGSVNDTSASQVPYDSTSGSGSNNSGSNNNSGSTSSNNAGVVGSGRTSAAQLSAAPTLAPPPPAPTGEAHIPPLLGVAPLGPVALSKEQQVCHLTHEPLCGRIYSTFIGCRFSINHSRLHFTTCRTRPILSGCDITYLVRRTWHHRITRNRSL